MTDKKKTLGEELAPERDPLEIAVAHARMVDMAQQIILGQPIEINGKKYLGKSTITDEYIN